MSCMVLKEHVCITPLWSLAINLAGAGLVQLSVLQNLPWGDGQDKTASVFGQVQLQLGQQAVCTVHVVGYTLLHRFLRMSADRAPTSLVTVGSTNDVHTCSNFARALL